MHQHDKGESENIDWRSRKGWETARIASEATRGLWFLWLFTIFWNTISAPAAFIIPRELNNENYAVLIAILFPLVGVFLLYRAVSATLEYRRYGKVLLELDPCPSAIGGHVGGRILVRGLDYRQAASATELWVRLECVYSFVSGSGKNRSRKESIKWAEQGKPQIDNSAHGVRLAFRFDVPANLPEADVDQINAYHFWRVTVKADISGLDLNRQYNIPVFATGEFSRSVHHDLSAQSAAQRDRESNAAKIAIGSGNFDIEGLSRAMSVSTQVNEIHLKFPMFRNKLLTLFAAIFAGGFGFASFSMAGTAMHGGLFGIFIGRSACPFWWLLCWPLLRSYTCHSII